MRAQLLAALLRRLAQRHRIDPDPVYRRGHRGGLALRVQGDRRQAVLRRYAQQPVSRLRPALGAALPGVLALSGCGWFSPSASKQAEACPSAVVLRPLSNTAVFGSAQERRPDNIAFYGILSGADLKCEYSGGNLEIAHTAVVVGERGPAAKGDVVDLPYFVAVTGRDQSIISKRPFAIRS